ncbi:MAG: hypothetical protein ACP5EN_00885 [Rhodovulum sp.]
MRLGPAALALLLAGCIGAPKARVSTLFLPDTNGLAVAGSHLRIDFGRAPEGVIAALTRAMGAPRPLGTETCPAGMERRVAWDDLVLTFTRESFVGWRREDQAAGRTCG